MYKKIKFIVVYVLVTDADWPARESGTDLSGMLGSSLQ